MYVQTYVYVHNVLVCIYTNVLHRIYFTQYIRLYVHMYIHSMLSLTKEDADIRNSNICRLSSFSLSISEL